MLSILKELLRPTAAKLIVFLLLGGYFTFFFIWGKEIWDDIAFNKIGFPLYGDFTATIIDLIIWYVISCLIVFCYEKIKNKSKK
ncbi:MAG: hypothetical protein ABIG96_00580 [Candidatus Micrarchaeota archaeon]